MSLLKDKNKLIKTTDICVAIDFLLSLSPSVALKNCHLKALPKLVAIACEE